MKTWLRGHSVTVDEVQGAYEAWLKSRAGKKHGDEVNDLFGSPDNLVNEIYSEIKGRCLKFDPIRYFMRREKTNGKLRRIGIQSIKQQVCDYLVVRALQGFLDAKLGYYQCASVPGKGQVFAKNHIEEWYAEGGYFAKHDIRKCFPSVDRAVLMAYLRKHVGSEDILYVIEAALSNYGTDNGLNIGSYLSQYLANLALSIVYHHIEDLHKIRRETRHALVTHQLWYMDDLVMFSRSKRDLVMAMRDVERFIATELHMSVKPWKVCNCGADPLDMVGYVIDARGTRMRPQLFLRSRRSFERMGRKPCISRARRCVSYWGFMKNSDCGQMRMAYKETFDYSKRYISGWERRHACSAQKDRSESKCISGQTGLLSASSVATSTRSPTPKAMRRSSAIRSCSPASTRKRMSKSTKTSCGASSTRRP